MMVTSQSLANLGAVLANDGIKPWDNERLISHEDNELVKKLLTTVGSFEESKEYTIKIELPIKSGTGGGLLACARKNVVLVFLVQLLINMAIVWQE